MALRSDGDSFAQRSSRLRHAAIVAIAVCASAFAFAALAAPVDDLRTAVEAGEDEQADAAHLHLVKLIDKAVKRGALHKNTGARKKSRAARLRRSAS